MQWVADGKEPGSVRATSALLDDQTFRRSVERLEGLPIRPSVARHVFAILSEDFDPAPAHFRAEPPTLPAATSTDPGWNLAQACLAPAAVFDPASVLVEQRWWQAATTSPSGVEALGQLWRHSVAVGFAARRLARETNDPDPDRVGRAGLLHHLGLWAVAAVDPDRLATWLSASPGDRSDLASRWLGSSLSAMGRRLAERWGSDPLVIDAVWLHNDRDGHLNACAAEPARLALIQQAHTLARRTPWAIDPAPNRQFGPTDPQIRLLTAEVQSRCGSNFIDPDATSREEGLTRDNIRLRRDLAQTTRAASSAARLVANLAEASPLESPQTWADRAALAWSGEPGVASAQVVWRSDDIPLTATQPPTATIALGDPRQPVADLRVWSTTDAEPSFLPDPTILAGWHGWARLVAERERLARLLDHAVGGHRAGVAREKANRQRTALSSLAEFAAGAGHEINNPLAVIMGRAQLLLARTTDPDTTRSLQAIISQAQRAHRILRDLMFVARPGETRPRACQPDEIVRASLRDLQHEAEAHGIRLVLDTAHAATKVWADPEPLRQVADILTRNAIEASPTGATVRFSTGGDPRNLRWVVHDTGRGISATDGAHLFDPFYCGRAAGRGLGLGLPRVARIIDQAGGEIRWVSAPDQGTTFQVTLPVAEIPGPIASSTERQADTATG